MSKERLAAILDITTTLLSCGLIAIGNPVPVALGVFFLARVMRASIVRAQRPAVVHCARCGSLLRISS